MRRGYGREVYALTRGGLSVKRRTLRNLLSDEELNRQKSAEVVVFGSLRCQRRTESIMENDVQAFIPSLKQKTKHLLREETVKSVGDLKQGGEARMAQEETSFTEECIL